MTRRFDPNRPVPAAVLDQALRHALRAPSAGFSQGWDFVVLTGAEQTARFWSAATEPTQVATADRWLRGVRSAPVLVVCCSAPTVYLDRYAQPDKGWSDRDPSRWPIPYWDVDTGMAALLILLTATDHDVGGLFFGVPAARHPHVSAALAIPADRRLVGVVALGYPTAGSAASRPRGPHRPQPRAPEQVIHHGRFGGSRNDAVISNTPPASPAPGPDR